MRALITATVLLGLGMGQAHAGFVDQSVQVTYQSPLGIVQYDLGTQVIAAGGTTFADIYSDQVTIQDTSITITFITGFSGATFNGFEISEVGPSPETITGVSLDTTTIDGFDTSRLTFDGADVFVNLQDYFVSDSSQTLTLDVAFAPTVAPEPASLTLLGLGVAGIGLRAWRRRIA